MSSSVMYDDRSLFNLIAKIIFTALILTYVHFNLQRNDVEILNQLMTQSNSNEPKEK